MEAMQVLSIEGNVKLIGSVLEFPSGAKIFPVSARCIESALDTSGPIVYYEDDFSGRGVTRRVDRPVRKSAQGFDEALPLPNQLEESIPAV
jgi:hypothetical protein